MYQFASATRRGQLASPGAEEVTQAPPRAVPAPDESARGTLSRERHRLVALDLAVVGAVSALAGSTGAATLIPAASTMAAFAAAGLYRPRLRYSALDDVASTLIGVGVALPVGAWLALPGLRTPPAFAAAPIMWPFVVVACVLLGRALGYSVLHHLRRRDRGEPTLIIGSGGVALRLAEVLVADRTYGLAPVGLVGPPPLPEPRLPVHLVGLTAELEAVISRYRPRHVVVTFPGPPAADLVSTLRRCRRRGVTVFVVPRLFEMAVSRGTELVEGIPLMRMGPDAVRTGRWFVKRIIDVTGAALGLVVLSPVLAICALAVRWESGRQGVLFRQERIGRDGKPFTILKFRSLTPSSPLESRVRWSIDSDARVGPVGRVLRMTSLDELPQLLNVLRGDMSLVGPRPERSFFVEQFERTYGGYGDRHRVPAGITGWAQIHGLRGDTSIEDRVRFDNHYIENWSLGLDLKIIIRTVGSMLSINRR